MITVTILTLVTIYALGAGVFIWGASLNNDNYLPNTYKRKGAYE